MFIIKHKRTGKVFAHTLIENGVEVKCQLGRSVAFLGFASPRFAIAVLGFSSMLKARKQLKIWLTWNAEYNLNEFSIERLK